ncbi:hypothetical protein KPaMU14_03235 [Kocuria palustris]|nr:hypothetical protein KPaMU14_03235 [Kocuria palustris]
MQPGPHHVRADLQTAPRRTPRGPQHRRDREPVDELLQDQVRRHGAAGPGRRRPGGLGADGLRGSCLRSSLRSRRLRTRLHVPQGRSRAGGGQERVLEGARLGQSRGRIRSWCGGVGGGAVGRGGSIGHGSVPSAR